MKSIKTAMTVASSDSGCGAGIQADLLTFAANNVFGVTAIASLTAQNPDKVSAIEACSSNFFKSQLDAINGYFKPSAMKCGMLFNRECIEILSRFAKDNRNIKFVADTVMIATSKAKLLKDDAIKSMQNNLLGLADIITPNLDEAKCLLGNREITDLFDCANELSKMYKTSVLLKGGHLQGDLLTDVLVEYKGELSHWQSERIKNINTHGSGCTLSAAICANLANGFPLKRAVELARLYLLDGMNKSIRIGSENFINHFPNHDKARRTI